MADDEPIDDDLADASFLARVAKTPEPPAGAVWAPHGLIGKLLDNRFRLVEVIGRGGMGLVFRAVQLPFEREVAVKVLRPSFGDDEAIIQRFEAEARIIAQLRHPNVVKLIDFGKTSDGLVYMVTELLHGAPLDEQLRHRVFDESQVVWLLRELAETLIETHAKGIVHRDLKPSNIFIERVEGRDHVKVLDFGIAKLVAGPSSTRSGMMIGTPAYMSPEQARGAAVDARTDLYSLGVIAFECLSGRLPFEGASLEALIYQHRSEAPPALRSIEGAAPVSPEMECLLGRLLQKAPEERPATALELREALRFGAAEPTDEPRVSTPRRSGARAALLGMGVVGLLGLVGGLTWLASEEEEDPTARFDYVLPPFAKPDLEPSGVGHQTIAVLPFEDMSPGQSQTYFARGIAEEILNVLAQAKGLRVSSRTSSFALQDRGLSVSAIAEQLGVAYVLEGSIRKAGDTVRVTSQLIDTARDAHIWSETFDRPLTMASVLAIQDEISAAIVGALKGKLTVQPSAGRSLSLEAYALFLEGRDALQARRPSSLDRAKSAFEQVIGLAPRFAPAYARLAETHLMRVLYAGADKEQAYERARALVARALELDPDSAESLTMQSMLSAKPTGDQFLAVELGMRAVAANPNDATAYLRLSEALRSAYWSKRALEAIEVARQLDPHSPVIAFSAGLLLLLNEKPASAREIADELLRKHPDHPFGHLLLCKIDFEAARYVEAYAHGQDARALNPAHTGLRHTHYVADIGLSGWHSVFSAGWPESAEVYTAVRRGEMARARALYGAMEVRPSLGLAYLLRDYEDAVRAFEMVLEPYLKAGRIARQPIRDEITARFFIVASFAYRQLGREPPVPLDRWLEAHYAERGPADGDDGLTLMNRANRAALLGQPEQVYGYLDRYLALGFTGDELDHPIFDGLRDAPEFQQRVARSEALLEKYRAEIRALAENPKPAWVAPLLPPTESTADPE